MIVSANLVAELSWSALRYGAALRLGDPAALAARLYGFNRWPLSPKLLMSLPSDRQLREFVLKEGPAELTRYWRSQRHAKRSGWLTWIRRDGSSRVAAIPYKLFVSPAPTAVRDALRVVVPELTQSRCFHFKVGAAPAELARPDKLVAYFPDREETLRVATRVADRLRALPSHGVPFSCAVDSGTLVSWGVDPPHEPDEQTSWRKWLCAELAHAITERASGDCVAAGRARLQAVRIDPESWEPEPGMWERRGPE